MRLSTPGLKQDHCHRNSGITDTKNAEASERTAIRTGEPAQLLREVSDTERGSDPRRGAGVSRLTGARLAPHVARVCVCVCLPDGVSMLSAQTRTPRTRTRSSSSSGAGNMLAVPGK